jgi:hypothetical protein
MSAISRLALAGAGAALLVAAPAWSVGLGPLNRAGITDGPRKAFYLTLSNPYRSATAFHTYAVGADDEVAQDRVRILPGDVTLGGGTQRQLLVIAGGLAPGEVYNFRVCAERKEHAEGMIHARVCSRLSARRLAAGQHAGAGGQ